ncbi:MAG TPA: [FeFe] hydrogenase H-cluster radical SAM maturase HydE [bacterium]|nr:[FeFe] hydrogenase H-cluster radical SAM maturase HydE [bacterium]
MLDKNIPRSEIEVWLRETDSARLAELWAVADRVRRENVGDQVHLRGLIELSNICVRSCLYCGIRAPNGTITRYRMNEEEIFACARLAVEYGYGTVVMQAGEDYGIRREWLTAIIRRIKSETPLAITLSLGERPDEDLVAWREAGADRYLLRFETSDDALYEKIHPPLPDQTRNRMDILRRLKELGYQTGSGVMIGIPGQTYSTLARDVEILREFDLDMIGVGPFLAHPETPLGRGDFRPEIDPAEQVPGDETTATKVVALARIVCPQAHIPSTTALATIDREHGRVHGLERGANVIMPNLTPPKYRELYEIYPNKAAKHETAEETNRKVHAQLAALGRRVGSGRGDR